MNTPFRPSSHWLLVASAWVVAGAALAADTPVNDTGRLSEARIRAATARVDDSMIRANAATSRDWPSHGLDYAETRFNRLRQITEANVKDLGLVWTYNLESTRGVEAFDSIPGPYGAHNWHSMSFNPGTGLAYLPAQNVPINQMDDKNWTPDSNLPGQPHSGLGWNTGILANTRAPATKPFGRLLAWDPVAQKEAWRVEQISPWNGGTLTSAGNLVFQGTADGRFIAYNAITGVKLWESPVGTGVVAAPVTYEVDGVQYVSIAVGWGGVYGLSQRATERQGPGTVYTYALGGGMPLPEAAVYAMNALVAGVKYDPAQVQEGTLLYVSNCVFCHGVPGVDRGGNIRNLGYMSADALTNLDRYVFKGPFIPQGMPDFTGKLTAEEVAKIRAFIQGTADAIRPK